MARLGSAWQGVVRLGRVRYGKDFRTFLNLPQTGD